MVGGEVAGRPAFLAAWRRLDDGGRCLAVAVIDASACAGACAAVRCNTPSEGSGWQPDNIRVAGQPAKVSVLALGGRLFRGFFDGLGVRGRVVGSIRAAVGCFAPRFRLGFRGSRFLRRSPRLPWGLLLRKPHAGNFRACQSNSKCEPRESAQARWANRRRRPTRKAVHAGTWRST
jgi:hypothetical protein